MSAMIQVLTPIPARRRPVTESLIRATSAQSIKQRVFQHGTYFVANDGEELAILVVCLRSHIEDCWFDCYLAPRVELEALGWLCFN